MEYETTLNKDYSPNKDMNFINNYTNDNTVKKENKFQKFFSLFSFFNKQSVLNDEIAVNPFEAQAGLFLSAGNYEAYIKMLNEGYNPTKNQIKTFDTLVHDLFFNRKNPDDGYSFDLEKDLSMLESLLDLGYKLKQSDVLEFIKKADNTILADNESFFKNQKELMIHTMSEKVSYPNLSEQIREHIKQDSFTDQLFHSFKSSLEDKTVNFSKNFSSYSFILKNDPGLILRKTPLSEFLLINSQFIKKSSSKEQQETMNNIINQYYSKDMQPFYMNVKEKYTSDFIESMIVNQVKREIDTLKEIPKEALDIIQGIEITFKNIKTKLTNSADIEHLNIMLDKRIPEVLSKYLTIDPDYRTSLKNIEGKNAQELMIESLDNIASLFQSVYKDMNQESVNSLSATNRYTKALKN